MPPRARTPLRILLWYWGRRGGGAQYALGLARALAARDDVTLTLALSSGNELLAECQAIGCPVALTETYYSRASFLRALPRIPAATRALAAQARGADVVVSAMTHLWTPFVARHLPAPYVPVIHDARPHPGDPAFAWDWRLDRELAQARAAVALSEAVAAALRARRPGLPLIRLRLPALLAEAGAAPPPSERAPEFLFFGRLRPYKGLDVLRDAFALLRVTHPEARLRVVGEGDAEACAPGLTALPGVIVEQRWVPEAEIPALLGTARAVVLPYTEASQSGVVPQALALGVPVVATPVGGLPEQVRQEAGGLLAEAATPVAMAHAMARVLEPGALPVLRAAARRSGETGSDWAGEAAKLVEFLRLLQTPTPRLIPWGPHTLSGETKT
jgi:glycosyltransferase involved in cell wall biosynthesis